MPAWASLIRNVSHDTTRYLKSCNWRLINASGYFDADVTILIIARFSPSFVFLEYFGPPKWLTLPSVIFCCQFQANIITFRSRLRPIRLFDHPASLKCTMQNLFLSYCLYAPLPQIMFYLLSQNRSSKSLDSFEKPYGVNIHAFKLFQLRISAHRALNLVWTRSKF